MARLIYTPKKFGKPSLDIITVANQICADYQAQGFDLTLRQLYYQFVARGYIANKQTEYKRLGSIINDARMAGMIDWSYLTDRTRNIDHRNQFTDAEDFIRRATRSWFHTDFWENQDVHVEVWVEKEALAGVVQSVTYDLDVTSLACRGYMSQSEQWAAAQRFLKYVKQGKRIVVIHLGDHDPSGVDMSRDNDDRLLTFLHTDLYRHMRDEGLAVDNDSRWGTVQRRAKAAYGYNGDVDLPLFELKRIALNMDQIEEYDPPPNPAKLTDSRSTSYIENYGDESWELDALPPDVLANLITTEVRAVMDEYKFEDAQHNEIAYRERIELVLERHGDELELDFDDDPEV